MKFKTTLLFVFALILIAATTPQKSLKGKLRSVYMDKWHDTLIYHYDDNGRLSSISSIRGYHTTYEYTGNKIIASTKGGSIITMYLNGRGLVDSLTDIDTNRKTITTASPDGHGDRQVSFGLTRYFPYSGSSLLPLDQIAGATTPDIMKLSKTYSYDAAGNLTEEKIDANGYRPIDVMTNIKNGNIFSYGVVYPIDTVTMIDPKTLKEDIRIISQLNFLVKNEYDNSKANSLTDQGWFGKSSKNLITRSVQYQQKGSSSFTITGDSSVTTFKYSFDKDGRVSSLITKVKNNDPADVRIYTERPDTCYFTYY